jgi:hypothetical protein
MTFGNACAAFFAGAFLANLVPHFVKGICGDRFPTPFATPRGIGLSSPLVNVVWGLANLVAGFFLFRAGKVGSGALGSAAVFFAGFALLSVLMAPHFAHKHQE